MLEPLLKPIKHYHNIGFDIETYGKKNLFYMGSFAFDSGYKVFYDKNEMQEYVLSNPKLFKNSIIWAHNLGFDFLGGFDNVMKDFHIIDRGSEFITAKSYVIDGQFCFFSDNKYHCKKIIMNDTLNFIKGSLQKVGEIIKHEKLEKPSFIGNKPKNEEERIYLENYNINDSMICKKTADFFQDNFNRLGAEIKPTIASTAMDLFRRKYLRKSWHSPSIKLIDIMKLGYYGGRTEIYKRGFSDEALNIYDVNSLYPSVMYEKEYPDVNTMRYIRHMIKPLIMEYEGLSNVSLFSPKENFPLLPFREDGKLKFPNGNITGYYTHAEIREALKNGYTLNKIKDGFYYKRNFSPFKEYVLDLYNERMNFKKENSPFEIVPKILLNSLYGKFGTRLDNKTEIIATENIDSHEEHDLINTSGFARVKKHFTEKDKPQFINPIISIYITAYARLKLFDTLKNIHEDVFYVDTDSYFTTKKLPTSEDLGKLKLEYIADSYYLVKPKFYALKINDKYKCKIKGCHHLEQHYTAFEKVLEGKNFTYEKFIKMREALRRQIPFNMKMDVEKKLDLEDNKRDWLGKKFNKNEFQDSKPLLIGNSSIL